MRLAFTLAVFLSACLLFLVEPMFGKMVLPLLGGSPAVWTTCMLFFQGALLLGYLYAHIGPRRLGVRRHIVLHLGLLALALLLLPVGVPDTHGTFREYHPTLWLLWILTLSLGAPFTLLASTGPLLQVWFSQTTLPGAENPYFLYVASNAGSLLGLLVYPFLVEPTIPLEAQARYWSFGYLILIMLVGVSAARQRGPASKSDRMVEPGDRLDTVSSRKMIRWVILAFVPSSFLLAVTTYVTTDVAAVPLLWIVPLVLYLLSFTMVFARRTIVPHPMVVRWQPVGLISLAILDFWGPPAASLWLLPVHLIVFFVTALVCHGELAATKPRAAHLTDFYLSIAIGGVLGGIFNALLAPALFDSVLEYPLTLLIACAVRPQFPNKQASRPLRWDIGLIVFASLVLVLTRIVFQDRPAPGVAVIASALAGLICLRMSRYPQRLTLAIAGVVIAGVIAEASRPDLLLKERNFFGVREVREDARKHLHVLTHGSTRHGAQSTLASRRRDPISYYNRQGPLGDIFRVFPPAAGRRIAIVGLGTGATAAYAEVGERWTFYEIDPDIARVAQDDRYFTYLRDTPAKVEIIFGDGRLSLSSAPAGSYDIIVLDAFSSDAIPTHLLTLEALTLYRSKLTNQGVLVFHLSNRYLDLEPVLGRLVQAAGLSGLIRVNTAPIPELLASGGDPSIWAAVAAQAFDLHALHEDERWRPLQVRPHVGLWTDDFSNIFRVLRRPLKPGENPTSMKQTER